MANLTPEPKEIKMVIDNPFSTKVTRLERKSTVFKRAYYQLTEKKLNPGKLVPIFTHIGGEYKMFGVLTLNTGGSVSFFPDFYNLDNFHHLTLSIDFINKKCHLTKVESTGLHTKTVYLETSPLIGNKYYHLITFGMDSDDLLMDSPSKIEIPTITYITEEEGQKYNNWINESAHGTSTLDFPDEPGSYFAQIFIIPKGESKEGLAIERTFVEKILVSELSFEGKTFNCKVIEIPTPDKCDFTICILTFKVDVGVKGTFGFMMAQDTANPFTGELL